MNMSHTEENHIASYKGTPMENTSSSSPPIGDSFHTSIWDSHMINPSLGFCDNNNMHNASRNSTTTGNMFVPSGSGLIPQGLSQFPADSGFIERAARFSSFGRENFSDLIHPYVGLDGVNPYARGDSTGMMQLPQRVLSGNDLKSLSGEKSPKTDVSRKISLFSEKSEGGVVSDEAEFSGGGSVGGEPSSSKALGLMKRKREYQGNKLGENGDVLQPPDNIAKDDTETQPKEDQKPTSTSKSNEKQGKKGSQALDSPKEEYIHVRARRGQATNSHSLAERVRREKISERMKFLQDLVPGCSKVTGKAVMLDEIINYVQSLQRQVEFLSMKLATVNPCLDFDLESVLAKDVKDSYYVDYYNAMLQPRIGPSSSVGYFPDMLNMPLRPSQPELIQPFLSGIATSSDPLRRSISSQLLGMNEGYKHPSQVANMWVEDELHNVVHMGLNSTAPLDIPQDLNGSMSQSHINPEL